MKSSTSNIINALEQTRGFDPEIQEKIWTKKSSSENNANFLMMVLKHNPQALSSVFEQLEKLPEIQQMQIWKARDSLGRNILMNAAYGGTLDTFKLLLNAVPAGIKEQLLWDACDKAGNNIMIIAARHNPDVFAFLLPQVSDKQKIWTDRGDLGMNFMMSAADSEHHVFLSKIILEALAELPDERKHEIWTTSTTESGTYNLLALYSFMACTFIGQLEPLKNLLIELEKLPSNIQNKVWTYQESATHQALNNSGAAPFVFEAVKKLNYSTQNFIFSRLLTDKWMLNGSIESYKETFLNDAIEKLDDSDPAEVIIKNSMQAMNFGSSSKKAAVLDAVNEIKKAGSSISEALNTSDSSLCKALSIRRHGPMLFQKETSSLIKIRDEVQALEQAKVPGQSLGT